MGNRNKTKGSKTGLKGAKLKNASAVKSPSSKRYIIRKAVVLIIIIILALILYIDAQTGFIKSMIGDKTFEIKIRK